MRDVVVPHFRSILLACAALLTASVARAAGDAVDSRVTFTFADDNVLAGPSESSNGSPSVPNSLPSGQNRLFFDDFESRDRGFENLTHLVLYMHQPGFFEGLDTEAALVLRAEVLRESRGDDGDGVKVSDDGSYIRIKQALGETSSLALTAFPMSADRFRLGYSYDISWGGSRIFKGSPAAPGARIDLKSESFYAFVGGKTGTAQQRQTDGTIESDTVWGLLAGAGVDVVDELRFEMGAGFFDRGDIEKEELVIEEEGVVETAPWQGYGVSGQVTYHIGMPIGTPVDFRLYKNDPLQRQSFLVTEQYGDGLSLLVRSEASVLGQTLQDPERPTSTVNQTAMAADFTAMIKYNKLRAHFLAVFRNLAFITYNIPSFAPFADFPDGIVPSPEWFASGGIDYFIEALHLTPGFIAGVQRPASITGEYAIGSTGTQQTFVFRDESNVDILNAGDAVGLIYALKGTLKFDLSESLAAVGELQYSYDPNRRFLAGDPDGISTFVPDDPHVLGFNIMMQARF